MQPIKLVNDTIDEADINSLRDWLGTYPKLTKGPVTDEFEASWAEYVGAKYAVFVNSGSSASLLTQAVLLESCTIEPGAEIIIPALCWSTDLAPAMQLGLKPLLCDCDPDNLGLSVLHLKELLEHHNPQAVVVVSVLGLVPNLEEIRNIIGDIPLIVDACEGFGSKLNDTHIGSYGDLSIYSTYFGHHLSTIEGGIICTDDQRLYNILKSIRSHGWSRDLMPEYQEELKRSYCIKDFDDLYTFYYRGFNVRATDVQAQIGLSQLNKADDVVNNRHVNYELYRNLLKGKMWVPEDNPNAYVSSFAYPIIHPNRAAMVQALQEANVEVRPLICGTMAEQPFYVKKYGYNANYLPNANKVKYEGFYVPNHPMLKFAQIDHITEVILSCQ